MLSREWGNGSLLSCSPYIIPNDSPHNPFPHSLLSTRQPIPEGVHVIVQHILLGPTNLLSTCSNGTWTLGDLSGAKSGTEAIQENPYARFKSLVYDSLLLIFRKGPSHGNSALNATARQRMALQ